MAKERLGRGPDELTFRTRTGPRISVPNVPGARVPVYEVFAEDAYRLEWFLGDLLRAPDLPTVDVGAHVGTFAVALAGLHPGATVDCSEPAPETAAYCRRNVEQNGLGSRITVHERAVAGTTGRARLGASSAASALASLAAEGEDGLDVEAISFDDLVAALPAPPVLVKVDCEGGEYGFVPASSPASWASVERLVIEYHPVAGESWPALRDWFGDQGLTVQRDEPVGAGIGTAWLSRTPLPAQ